MFSGFLRVFPTLCALCVCVSLCAYLRSLQFMQRLLKKSNFFMEAATLSLGSMCFLTYHCLNLTDSKRSLIISPIPDFVQNSVIIHKVSKQGVTQPFKAISRKNFLQKCNWTSQINPNDPSWGGVSWGESIAMSLKSISTLLSTK